MNKTLLGLGVVLLAATACNGSSSGTANPTVTKEETAAQALVQHCAANANLLSKSGREAFYKCLAPSGEKAAVQHCATQALAHDGVLTKHARERFYADLSTCVLPTPTATPKGRHS